MSVNKTRLSNSILKRGNYAPVPNELWSLKLSIRAKTAYCYLVAQSEDWRPGLRSIAEGISASVNTARAAIKELEDANMIEVEHSPNGLRNIYSFTGIDEWNLKTVSTGKETVSAGAHSVSPVERLPYHQLHTSNKKYNKNPEKILRIEDSIEEENLFTGEEQSHNNINKNEINKNEINDIECGKKVVREDNKSIPVSTTLFKPIVSSKPELKSNYTPGDRDREGKLIPAPLSFYDKALLTETGKPANPALFEERRIETEDEMYARQAREVEDAMKASYEVEQAASK
jgi:hypothetical protein